MNILYLSGMPLPIANFLDGKEKIEGFPAYFWPMYKLSKRGHAIDFILISNRKNIPLVKKEWFSSTQIIHNLYLPYEEKKSKRWFRGIKRSFQVIRALNRSFKNKRYDFVYAHGPLAAYAQIFCWLKKIPIGVRWYGDSARCYPKIQKSGRFFTALRKPLIWFSFNLPYTFFLATDDNTNVDKLHQVWSRHRGKDNFFHWKTGVEMKTVSECTNDIELPEHPYIFYAGRFDRTKCVGRLIDTLKITHNEGHRIHLYLAGQTTKGASSLEYIDELKERIKSQDLTRYVHFMGSISQDSLKVWAHHALAVLFMYDISNLGNVFYEAMSVGSNIIATDVGSIKQFVNNGVNGYLVQDEMEAASRIVEMIINPKLTEGFKANAAQTAREKFYTIDQRFSQEVELIENASAFYRNQENYWKYVSNLSKTEPTKLKA